jgi:ADP-ribose pyrophosphatase
MPKQVKAPAKKQAKQAKPKKKLKKLVEKLAHHELAAPANEPPAEVLSSEVVYEGPLFKVVKDEVREPNGHITKRDVIRHNGSVVILPIDASKSRKDPLVIMERQYRHAAGQYLWEIPAGKIEEGEERLAGARRELLEETGYQAEHWTPLVRYFASPGFLGEWMQVYLAEGLTAGIATPEADETLQVFALPLSQVDALIDEGKILDGKTLVAVSLYKRLEKSRKKNK